MGKTGRKNKSYCKALEIILRRQFIQQFCQFCFDISVIREAGVSLHNIFPEEMASKGIEIAEQIFMNPTQVICCKSS